MASCAKRKSYQHFYKSISKSGRNQIFLNLKSIAMTVFQPVFKS